MSLLTALLLGIVEGITEFLPISSTGHLILTQHLLQIEQTDMIKSFDITIQLGAILAVVILYRKWLLSSKRMWLSVLWAFIPTGVIGLVAHTAVKTYLLGNTQVVVWSLFLGGIAIILFEKLYAERQATIHSIRAMPLTTAASIGLCQALSLVPGISRSAATIIGGMMLGVERKTAVDFAFLLAIPTMAAATGFDLIRSLDAWSADDAGALLVGFVTSFLVATIVIRWLLQFVRTNTFIPFGIYRIIAAAAFFVLVM